RRVRNVHDREAGRRRHPRRRCGVAARRRQLVVCLGGIGRRRQHHRQRDRSRRLRDVHDPFRDATQRAIVGPAMSPGRAMRALTIATALAAHVACGGGSTTPTPPPPALPTAAFTVSFEQNPVPFRPTGCSFSTPSGWYTSARIQETAGVAFTVTTLTRTSMAPRRAF